MNNESVSREKLVSDVKVVLSDAERRKEIDAILNDCRDSVRNLLLKKRHVVEGVRDALLEREELVGDESEVLMAELGEREPIEVPVTGNGDRAAGGSREGKGEKGDGLFFPPEVRTDSLFRHRYPPVGLGRLAFLQKFRLL